MLALLPNNKVNSGLNIFPHLDGVSASELRTAQVILVFRCWIDHICSADTLSFTYPRRMKSRSVRSGDLASQFVEPRLLIHWLPSLPTEIPLQHWKYAQEPRPVRKPVIQAVEIHESAHSSAVLDSTPVCWQFADGRNMSTWFFSCA